jgi:hypothetical protein
MLSVIGDEERLTALAPILDEIISLGLAVLSDVSRRARRKEPRS